MKGDLNKSERLEIKILLDKQYSLRTIAKAVGRSPNTISYEIKLNSVSGIYDPHKAHLKAQVRKEYRRFQYTKIEKYPEIKEFIINKNPTGSRPGYYRTLCVRYQSNNAVV